MFDFAIACLRSIAALLLTLLLSGCVLPVVQSSSPLSTPGAKIFGAGDRTSDAGMVSASPLCRFGINVSSFPDNPFYVADFDLTPLRVGWYIDYRAAPSAPANNGAEY